MNIIKFDKSKYDILHLGKDNPVQSVEAKWLTV